MFLCLKETCGVVFVFLVVLLLVCFLAQTMLFVVFDVSAYSMIIAARETNLREIHEMFCCKGCT